MKTAMLFTGSGPIVILTSHDSVTAPALLSVGWLASNPCIAAEHSVRPDGLGDFPGPLPVLGGDEFRVLAAKHHRTAGVDSHDLRARIDEGL